MSFKFFQKMENFFTEKKDRKILKRVIKLNSKGRK